MMSSASKVEWTAPRVDRLGQPPVKGRYYMVWAIEWVWGGWLEKNEKLLWWPVFNNRHDDREFFNVDVQHYHVDPRFLTQRHLAQVAGYYGSKLATVLGSPLSHRSTPEFPWRPSLKRFRCSRIDIPYPERFAAEKPVVALNKKFAGQHCHKGRRGFVCPHRHVALGDIVPIDGVITCPLHGMRIDAVTGRCIGPLCHVEPKKEAA